MKSKSQKNSFFRKVVAVICTMALLLSFATPYTSFAAAKALKSIILTYSKPHEADYLFFNNLDYEVYFGYEEDDPNPQESFELTEGGNVFVSRISESTGDVVSYKITPDGTFPGSRIRFYMGADSLPVFEPKAKSNVSISATEVDENLYEITINAARQTASIDYEVTIGDPPAPEYTVDFDIDDDTYTFTDVTIGGKEVDVYDAPFTNVKQGEMVNFTVEAQPGFEVKRVNKNGSKIGSGAGSYSIEVDSNIEITATTSNAQYTISGLESPEDGYEVIGNKIIGGKTTVGYGDNYSFTVTTPEGKENATVTVDGGARATYYNGQWIISNITKNVNVTIKAGGAKAYVVNMPDETVGYSIENYAVSEDGVATIAHGGTYTFDIKLNDKYSQSTPKVTATNGTVTVEPKSDTLYACTLKNVTANTAISVSNVTRNPYVISGLDNGDGYTVIGTSKIENGKASTKDSSYTFYVRATEGFGNPKVIISEGDAVIIDLNDGQYIINGITDDVAVEITSGETKTYTISVPDETVGYTVVAPASVTHNGSCTIKVNVDEKYDQSTPKVTATNGTVTFESKVLDEFNNVVYSYTLAGVTADTTISVSGVVRNPYVITGLKSGEGYTVTASSAITEDGTVNTRESSYTFYVKAAEGYEAPNVGIASGSAVIANPSEGTYIINSITDDVAISITAGELKTYSVRFVNGTGFRFNKSVETIKHNDGTIEFTIALDSAYSQSANNLNVSITSGNGNVTQIRPLEYIITGVTADTTVTVDSSSIELNSYTVSGLNSLPGYYTVQGSIEVDGTAKVKYGSSYSFYVYAADGRQEPTVTADGKACIKNGNQYTIENITDNLAITIEAGAKIKYTVTLNKTDGCNFINLSGDVISSEKVDHDDSFEFKLQETKGYDISGAVVQVDGRTITPDVDGIYTINNITANTIVSVSGITKSVYKVTMDQVDGASISASSLSVSDGEDYYFNVAVDPGYELVAVNVNGTKISDKVGMHTIAGVTGNLSISVEVKKITYSIAVNSGEFTTSLGVDETVLYGDDVSFTVAQNPYYKVTRVTVNGTEYFPDDNGVYTVSNVTSNLSINVSTTPVTIIINYNGNKFADNKTITYTYDGKESIDKNLLETVESNEKIYIFNGWTMDADALKFDPDADKTVMLTANWVDNREYIRSNVVLTTKHQTISSDSVNIRTYIDVTRLKYNTEFQGAEIIAYGTLLTKSEAVDDNDVYKMKDLIMNGRHLTGDSNGLNIETFKDEEKNSITNYYYVNRSIDPIDMGYNNFVRLSVSGLTPDTMDSYRALGWVQIRVGDETMIIFSDYWDTGFSQSNEEEF